MQNFVMAFGGTGARCAEALAYLAASRSITDPLHLLLVDPDQTNGNVAQAVRQLRNYQTINNRVQTTPRAGEKPFFSTPMNAALGPESFFWANPQPPTEFSTLIEYGSQPDDARALIDLLYDQGDLDMTFEKGYVGRAHIGSLDLLRTFRQQIERATVAAPDTHGKPDSMLTFFRALRSATQQPDGARLLVIGSVFGGTGASGLPAVPPLLQQVLLSGLQNKLTLGCVQIAPYFTFPLGRPEDPDSALHPIATQAALYHYSLTNTGYHRVYLIGAPAREQSNDENVVGGDAQLNTAHYVELGAGLAAAHFFAQSPKGDNPEVVACGSDEISWDKLPFRTATNVRKNLVALGTFCMMHAQFLEPDLEQGRHVGSKWYEDLVSRDGRTLGGQEEELQRLRDFGQRFLAWSREVQRTPGVALFTVGAERSESALASVTSGGESAHPYHDIFSRLSRIGHVAQDSGPGWYVEALTKASISFCEDTYQRWWN